MGVVWEWRFHYWGSLEISLDHTNNKEFNLTPSVGAPQKLLGKRIGLMIPKLNAQSAREGDLFLEKMTQGGYDQFPGRPTTKT